MATIYLKDTSVLASDEERAFVASAINKFSTGGHPVADAKNVGDFSVECAIDCLESAMMKGQAGGKHTVRLVSALLHRMYETQGDTEADADNDAMGVIADEGENVLRAFLTTKLGDPPPESRAIDHLDDAIMEAVSDWYAWSKRPKRDQRSDARAETGVREDEEGDAIDFADRWNPDRDFHARVSAEFPSFATLRGWSVSYDYPGYFGFRHKRRPNFTILATPDHGEEGFIAVDAQDDHGHNIDLDLPDVEWPLAERLAAGKVSTSHAARAFLNLMSQVLEKHEPKKLVLEFDVTGWSDAEIDNLKSEATVQGEANDDAEDGIGHPDAAVLRSEVVPMEVK